MKRLIIGILALAAVAPPVASAHEKSAHLVPVVVDGERATSRSAGGSCDFVAGSRTGDDLLLRCGRGSGAATAQYNFTLPANFVGKPAAAVSGSRVSCSGCSVRTKLVHLDGRRYRVAVSLSGAGQYDVQSVRFSYYVR